MCHVFAPFLRGSAWPFSFSTSRVQEAWPPGLLPDERSVPTAWVAGGLLEIGPGLIGGSQLLTYPVLADVTAPRVTVQPEHLRNATAGFHFLIDRYTRRRSRLRRYETPIASTRSARSAWRELSRLAVLTVSLYGTMRRLPKIICIYSQSALRRQSSTSMTSTPASRRVRDSDGHKAGS
jgi:hypothetical protein